MIASGGNQGPTSRRKVSLTSVDVHGLASDCIVIIISHTEGY
jgi:hypothetical protein